MGVHTDRINERITNLLTTARSRLEPSIHPEKTTRTVVAGVIGNVLEWYDFALFGFFAPVISRLFFPSEDRLASLLATFGVFAIGFVMRPVGGAVFGHIGDRVGRKKALELSVILMAVPTTLVGVLPTYHRIGIAAPIILTLVRMLQGASVGGELIGSMSFLGEHSPAGRRGLLGSWTSCSATGGVLIGSAVAALVTRTLPHVALLAWGWRVPFLCGSLVGLAGLWLRRGIAESPRFSEETEVARSPVTEALRRDTRAILGTFGLASLMAVGFYLPFVWLSTWMAHINRPPLDDALTVNTIALAAFTALIPAGGMLSDRLGRKPVLVAGAGAFLVLTYPLFLLLSRGTFASALGAQLAFAVCGALFIGTCPAAFVEMFPTRTRYSGIAIGYNLAQAILGGTTPLIATWLIRATGNDRAPAFYLMIAAAVAGTVALTMEDRSGQPLS
jgi:MHS family proline/betaine transporter-like MFS transporter